MKILLSLSLVMICLGSEPQWDLSWEQIDAGLRYTEFRPVPKASIGDGKVSVLEIDPRYYKFELLSAKSKGKHTQTALIGSKTTNW